jgi:hypothetical protein
MANSGTSRNAYSFSIDCPVCEKVVSFSCIRERVRDDSPLQVACTHCSHSWVVSADDKERLWTQLNFTF